MIEHRRLRPSEVDPFLTLLCRVFDLDLSLARPLFTSDPLFDHDRLWGSFDEGELVACLTTRPLEFGWGRAVGIAGVATASERRGRGLAGGLVSTALEASAAGGEAPALLFARRTDLYERLGFSAVDGIARAPVRRTSAAGEEPEFAGVRARYEAWSGSDPTRLRRDDPRWESWRWRFPTVVTVSGGDGYATIENGAVREAVHLPAIPGDERLDARFLLSMAGDFPLAGEPEPTGELLMARGCPAPARLFLTDQF